MSRFDRLSLRYTVEALSAAVLFVVVSYFVQPMLQPSRPAVELAALAALSTLPMGLILWSVVRYFRGVDERERHILAMAGFITLLAGVVAAIFLARLEVLVAVNLNYFAAFLMISWTFVTLLVRWKS